VVHIELKGKRGEGKKALMRVLKQLSPYELRFVADDKYKKEFKEITIVDLEEPQTGM